MIIKVIRAQSVMNIFIISFTPLAIFESDKSTTKIISIN